jgi:hypothetical protein
MRWTRSTSSSPVEGARSTLARLCCARRGRARNAAVPAWPGLRGLAPADAGRAWLRLLGAGAAVGLGLAGPAHAQLSGSLSLQNDYRIRGASVSEKRPAAALTLSDDLSNGVYFGASIVVGDTRDDGVEILGHTEYVGYAHRNLSGLTWEVGADNVDFEIYPAPTFHLSYSEAYVGLSNGNVSGRLYVSPNYLQDGLTIAYLDLTAVARPNDDWRFSGHLGFFEPLAGNARTPVRKDRWDVRVDVIRRLGPAEINLGWTSAFPAAFPAPWRSSAGVLAGVLLFF